MFQVNWRIDHACIVADSCTSALDNELFICMRSIYMYSCTGKFRYVN